MKSLIYVLISALLISGCGTQEYPKRPETARAQTTQIPIPPTQKGGRINNRAPSQRGKGYMWRGLEWVGMDESRVNQWRCSLNDEGKVREFQALAESLEWGAVIGVVVRLSGSIFFGRPAAPGGGHGGGDGHGPAAPEVSVFEKSIWGHLHGILRHGINAALSGAVFVGACETILAGGNFTSFDGLLGPDHAALSAALAVGGSAAYAANLWVWNLFGQRPPRPPVSAGPPAESPGEPSIPTEQLGNVQKLRDWSRTSGFAEGVRYEILPGLSIVGVSGGLGLLVYHRLHDDSLEVSKETAAMCAKVAKPAKK